MISLRQLIRAVPEAVPPGEVDVEQPVRGVGCDSRKAERGWIFVALRGEEVDGHGFVAEALGRGCLAAVVEEEAGLPEGAPIIRVADTHLAYGLLAARYHGNPARDMKIIGITGTNGKTTTSWLIEQLITTGGGEPGVIGTVNYRYRSAGRIVEQAAPLTTPEPMVLHGLLRKMKDAGVTHVIIEVSSHSLVQKRLAGMFFDVAVFTNLSRDHLDYHQSMEAYFGAKEKLFFEYLHPHGTAVVSIQQDDGRGPAAKNWGRVLAGHLAGRGFGVFPAQDGERAYITCGMVEDCRVRAAKVQQNIEGIACTISGMGKPVRIRSPLIGLHNISNMLAAAATGMALGMDRKDIRSGLQAVHRIPGRLERVMLPGLAGQKRGPQVFVDYAHTPDALENVLRTLRGVTPGRLFCVFGCGGNRDRGKRPMMGAIATSIADAVLITSDNPRNEKPDMILADIEKGVAGKDVRRVGPAALFALEKQEKGYALLENRCQAIHLACSRAGEEDVVLIAGKGHETYQITAAGKSYFDDRVEACNGAMRWKSDLVLAATSGELVRKGEDVLYNSISTDTRTLAAGDVFVALRGENFDGHEYVGAAAEKGAAALVVEQPVNVRQKDVAVFRVADTLRALGDLARYRRRLLGPELQVVGITGSSGKTTVKEMTAAIFAAAFENIPGQPVLKTKGNLNNLIGLPLSLLDVDAGHRVAVLEMGMNRPGEIDRLTQIADPDIGCITNVQAAHLEGLGSVEGVARAKGELFAAMPGRGLRVVNLDDPHVRKLGGTHGNNIVGFAVTPVGRRFDPAVRTTRAVSLGERGMRFTLRINEWRNRISVPATGMHNVANCAAAAAIATAAGIAPEYIVRGLEGYRSVDKRLQILDLPGNIHVVNDSYNANPSSMAAALKTVAGFGTNCRRAALLGDMFELGAGAVEAHGNIGGLVAELGYDYLGVTGEYANLVAERARNGGMKKSGIHVCSDKEAMADWIVRLIAAGRIGREDWLLIKGSRGMRMEMVLHFLMQQLKDGN